MRPSLSHTHTYTRRFVGEFEEMRRKCMETIMTAIMGMLVKLDIPHNPMVRFSVAFRSISPVRPQSAHRPCQ